MSHFVHFVEPVNEFGDDEDRQLFVSPGEVEGEGRIWLYAKGSDGGGIQMTLAEAIELGERIASLGREMAAIEGGAGA